MKIIDDEADKSKADYHHYSDSGINNEYVEIGAITAMVVTCSYGLYKIISNMDNTDIAKLGIVGLGLGGIFIARRFVKELSNFNKPDINIKR